MVMIAYFPHRNTADRPLLTGTGGIGFEDALALARGRAVEVDHPRAANPQRGRRAVASIGREASQRRMCRFELLDLASLGSVAEFGRRLHASRDSLDLLYQQRCP